MSHIDDLIQRLCPNGVEFKPLGEVIALKFGDRITKLADSGTLYPVYGGGGESFRTDSFNRGDDYVVSRFAMSATCVRRVAGHFWLLDSGFSFDSLCNDLLKDFVAWWLFNSQPAIYACSSEGAQKNLRTEEFKKFRIPVPPLEVQREIVRVLDLFQSLEAELEARRCQYAHYRNALLSFDNATDSEGVKWLTLSEIATDFGRGKSSTGRATRPICTEARTPSFRREGFRTALGSACSRGPTWPRTCR
jgi:type I restriction enzyme, S subunit